MESRFITNLTDGWIINGEMVLAHYDPPVLTTAPQAFVDEGWLAATGLRLATQEEAEAYELLLRNKVDISEGVEVHRVEPTDSDPDPVGPPVELAEPEPETEPTPEPHRRGRK
jgi:hypothetical protein